MNDNVQGKSSGSEMEVTWQDQQNINTFSRFNNRFHELEDEIKFAKVLTPSLSSNPPKRFDFDFISRCFQLRDYVKSICN